MLFKASSSDYVNVCAHCVCAHVQGDIIYMYRCVYEFVFIYMHTRASQVVLVVKKLPVNAGDVRKWAPSLVGEDPLEEGMVTHSSILTWRIPWIEEPGWL